MDFEDSNKDLFDLFVKIANEGMQNAACGFSDLVGRKIEIKNPTVMMASLLEIPQMVGGPEKEVVGIYLRAEGELNAQIMLIIPYQESLELVDLVMDLPPGTTTRLGSLECSALGEVGNLTGSFFLNVISNLAGYSCRPTPPAVMVDMIGALMDIVIAAGAAYEKFLLIKADFIDGMRSVEADFWVIPDPSAIQALQSRV